MSTVASQLGLLLLGTLFLAGSIDGWLLLSPMLRRARLGRAFRRWRARRRFAYKMRQHWGSPPRSCHDEMARVKAMRRGATRHRLS